MKAVGFAQIPEWGLPSEALALQVSDHSDFSDFSDVSDFSAADLVVSVGPGLALNRLNEFLAPHGLTVPYDAGLLGLDDFPIAALIGYALPHLKESKFGSWRDWILGVRLRLADGSEVKAGAKVVKSVAGYDLHKMIVGARGCFFMPIEITLRLYPLNDFKASPTQPVNAIQRVWPTDFASALEKFPGEVLVADQEMSTLYGALDATATFNRFKGDFVLQKGCGTRNFAITDPTQAYYAKHALDTFDPERKFNPGALGI